MMKAPKIKEPDHLYPSSSYDYDGIVGVWLAIPPIIHLIFAIITLILLIYLLPHIHFRGPLQYLFTDYQKPLGIAATLFFIASALLSKLKSYQVTHKAPKNRQKGLSPHSAVKDSK